MAWRKGISRTSTDGWKRLRAEARRVLPVVCATCGRFPAEGVAFELDHIIPVAEGGVDSLSNVQWLCVSCHAVKTRAESARGVARRVARRRLPDRYADCHPGLK